MPVLSRTVGLLVRLACSTNVFAWMSVDDDSVSSDADGRGSVRRIVGERANPVGFGSGLAMGDLEGGSAAGSSFR